MNYIKYVFGSYTVADGNVPVPDELKNKDMRADPVAKAAVFSAVAAVRQMPDVNLEGLGVIAINRQGCASYVKQVVAGVEKRLPRHGLFVRGGPQTLATYTALALGCHGPAFTIVGDEPILADGIVTALLLANCERNSGSILTTVSSLAYGGFHAKSVLITVLKREIDSSNPHHLAVAEDIFRELSKVFHTG